MFYADRGIPCNLEESRRGPTPLTQLILSKISQISIRKVTNELNIFQRSILRHYNALTYYDLVGYIPLGYSYQNVT